MISSINDDYFKIVSEALRALGSFINVVGPSPAGPGYVSPIYDVVMKRLAATDIDQEVKNSSILAMANLISIMPNKVPQNQVEQVMGILKERLKNEMTRSASLKAITKIFNSA